jgi:phosphatidylglycerol---prolipoprotein diacylglyceryl transferase
MQFFPTREIALAIGPFSIHWYGIMYLLGFLIGIWLIPRLQKLRGLAMTERQRESLVLCVFFGVLVGGRLGYVLFYGLPHFIANPAQIFAVWQGGMSSHGGITAVTLALIVFSRRNGIPLLKLADVLMVPVAIGLALGRVGNYINLEIYGTVTDLPWAMAIPGVEGLRHPTQIYAVLKDLFIASACFLHLKRTAGKEWAAGQTTALFLVLYGILRFVVEHFRDQPHGFVHMAGITLSPGQALTLPVIALGIGVFAWTLKRPQAERSS